MRDDDLRADFADEFDDDAPGAAVRAEAGRAPGLPPASAWLGAALAIALLFGLGTWLYGLGTQDPSQVPVIAAASTPAKSRPTGMAAAGSTPYLDMESYTAQEARPAGGARDGVEPDITLAPPPARPTEEDQPEADLAALAAEIEATAATDSAATDSAATDPAAASPLPPAAAPEAGPDPATRVPAPVPQLSFAPPSSPAESAARPADAAQIPGTAEAPATTPRADEEIDLAALPPAREIETAAAEEPETAQPGPGEEAATPLAPTLSPTAPSRPGDLDKRMVAAAAAAQISAQALRERAAASTIQIQLGAYPSADETRAQWQRISTAHREILLGRVLAMQTTQSGGQTWYRLRVGPFSGRAEANSLCEALQARGQACIVATNG